MAPRQVRSMRSVSSLATVPRGSPALDIRTPVPETDPAPYRWAATSTCETSSERPGNSRLRADGSYGGARPSSKRARGSGRNTTSARPEPALRTRGLRIRSRIHSARIGRRAPRRSATSTRPAGSSHGSPRRTTARTLRAASNSATPAVTTTTSGGASATGGSCSADAATAVPGGSASSTRVVLPRRELAQRTLPRVHRRPR